jgi:hypothetical protein
MGKEIGKEIGCGGWEGLVVMGGEKGGKEGEGVKEG